MGERYQKIKMKIRDKLPFFIMFSLIILFLCAYLYNNIVFTIHSGEGGVLYRRFLGGTVIDKVYPEGIHFILPWDVMYIYNVRVQQIAHKFDVLTKNGLKIHLSISIRYFPEYDLLGVLHKKVGPQYVDTVVIPEIEAVLRMLIGRLDAQEVYTTERSIIEKSLNEAVEQVAQRFVIVDDVLIKKMQLPLRVEEAVQNKIEQKHLAEAHIFKIERQKREAERKRIEGEGMRDYNKTVNESLSYQILQWMAIQATLELAKSENSKVVVVGTGRRGLPVFGSLILDAPENTGFLPSMNGAAGSSEPTGKRDASKMTGKSASSDMAGESETSEMTDNSASFGSSGESDNSEMTDNSASSDTTGETGSSEPMPEANVSETTSTAVPSDSGGETATSSDLTGTSDTSETDR